MRFAIKTSNAGEYLVCDEPEQVLFATQPDEIPAILDEVERLQNKGYYLGGWLSYEAASGFDSRFHVKESTDLPLVLLLASRTVTKTALPAADHLPLRVQSRLEESVYQSHFDQLNALIHAGDLYQANFSFRADVVGIEDGLTLFQCLEHHHPMPYAAFVEYEDWQVISLSPELFLKRHDKIVSTEPMKGTINRGLWFEQDEQQKEFLRSDAKNRAENLMIVDLMRNDLSKICEPRTVEVSSLFETKRFPSIHQMVSEVRGLLREDVSLFDILKATFPAGSITGTPKVRAMEVIRDIEGDARNVYTGSVGIFLPGGDFQLNVAIRTLTSNRKIDSAELGIGSGVVSSSSPDAEWQECLLKGNFLNYRRDFNEIFETMLWSGHYHWLEEHLQRLENSCAYFSVPFDKQEIIRRLEAMRYQATDYRVRLSLNLAGEITVVSTPLPQRGWGSKLRVLVGEQLIDETSCYQYHKTDRRQHYDQGFELALKHGFAELLFFNQQHKLAEGAISNVFLMINGEWLTPSLACGLLPGVWRQYEIDQLGALEAEIDWDMMLSAERIRIGNSVRFGGDVSELWTNDELVWSSETRITRTS